MSLNELSDDLIDAIRSAFDARKRAAEQERRGPEGYWNDDISVMKQSVSGAPPLPECTCTCSVFDLNLGTCRKLGTRVLRAPARVVVAAAWRATRARMKVRAGPT